MRNTANFRRCNWTDKTSSFLCRKSKLVKWQKCDLVDHTWTRFTTFFLYLIKITCYFEAQTEPALLSAQFIMNWIGQVDFNQFFTIQTNVFICGIGLLYFFILIVKFELLYKAICLGYQIDLWMRLSKNQ